MATPNDRKYSKSHEWVKLDGNTATIGISDHAQDSLGDITFVELPEVGKELKKGSEFGVVESVKAASDLYAPVSGKVVEVNDKLGSEPEIINSDPYEGGWLMKVEVSSADEANELMDAQAYDSFAEQE